MLSEGNAKVPFLPGWLLLVSQIPGSAVSRQHRCPDPHSPISYFNYLHCAHSYPMLSLHGHFFYFLYHLSISDPPKTTRTFCASRDLAQSLLQPSATGDLAGSTLVDGDLQKRGVRLMLILSLSSLTESSSPCF